MKVDDPHGITSNPTAPPINPINPINPIYPTLSEKKEENKNKRRRERARICASQFYVRIIRGNSFGDDPSNTGYLQMVIEELQKKIT